MFGWLAKALAFCYQIWPSYGGAIVLLTVAIMIVLLLIPAALVVFVVGFLTFGIAWLLIPALFAIVALGYVAFTLGGPRTATLGMRMVGLEMRTWSGAPVFPLLAIMHALIFWFSVSLLTPLVLLVGLFTARRQLLHDLLINLIMRIVLIAVVKRNAKPCRHNIFCVEARIHVEHPDEAADKQTGADKQHETNGGLRDHEAALQAVTRASTADTAPAFTQSGVGIDAGDTPCGEQSEEDAGKHRDGDGEDEDGSIDGNLRQARDFNR